MGLDWVLIEYRPGRYAKVSSDGTFLGPATEAEVRAWFSASPPPASREEPSHGQDAGQAADAPGSAGISPSAPSAAEPSREPEVPWEEPLIWAPPRPGPAPSAPPRRKTGKAQPEPEESWAKPMLWAPPPSGPETDTAATEPFDREIKDSQPEPDESWTKPMLWAPTQPAPKPETDDPATETPTPEPSAREVEEPRPEPDESWAKPMLWGRPPAVKRDAEAPSSTAGSVATVPGKASLRADQLDAEPETFRPNQEKVPPVELDPAAVVEPQPAPEVEDSPDLAGGSADRPEQVAEPIAARPVLARTKRAGPQDQTQESQQEPVRSESAAVAGTRPAFEPGEIADPGLGTTAEATSKPDSHKSRPGSAAVESAAGVGGPEARSALVQVAMDLNGLESIAPSVPEPEPEPEETRADVNPLAAMLPAGLAASTEPAAEIAEATDPEPVAPAPEAAPPDAEQAGSEPEAVDEPVDVLPVAADLPEPDEEPGAPLAETPQPEVDAEEDWLEEDFLEGAVEGTDLEADRDESNAELEVFAPPPASARRTASAAPGLEADTGDLADDDLEADPAAVEDLWLWVDPRYEGGYSPATFDLAAFLQRAIALFQSKAWSGGHPPGRIAVHASEADADLGSVAERLELTVIEDARVSGGTYWLGLGSDGGPDEHD